MKRILMIVENKIGIDSMLKKALRFSPESIHLHCFESLDASGEAVGLQAILDGIVKGQCTTELTVESGIPAKEMGRRLEDIVTDGDFEMVILHRVDLGKELPDFSLIKAAMRSSTISTIFLCGDNRWNEEARILATLDVVHDNEIQVSLNKQVLKNAELLAESLEAKIEVLSVIALSRVNTELEIEDPSMILKKNRGKIEAKLEEFIREVKCSAGTSVRVAAGLPSLEISIAAKKRKADIVVLGNVGRTGIKGLVVGNTAEKILNRLPADALIVKR